MKALKIAFGIATMFCLGACMQPVADYISSARPDRRSDAPSLNAQGPSAMKVSPGRMSASAPGVALIGNASPTNQMLTSPQVSIRASISRTRTSK